MDEVLIAGGGFAASMAALRLLQLGFRPRLLIGDRPDIAGIEILPAAVHPLLATLELGPALAELGPSCAIGMVRRWMGSSPEFRPGHALHVERLALRRRMLGEATRRGAAIERVDRLSRAPETRGGWVRYDGRDYVAALDATGRRAAWSRPILRYARTRADVFAVPVAAALPYGVVLQLPHGWAYRADHEGAATIGIIGSPGPPSDRLPEEVAAAFDLPEARSATYLGRRPAFAQAAGAPLHGRVIAIGDAAFAHDPIGGRGLSFALGSAFAAAAAVKTLRERPKDAAAAMLYYRRYVESEQARHLAFLRDFYAGAPVRPPLALPDNLRWRGAVQSTALNFDDGVRIGDAVRLSDGGWTRWLGRFDLLRLRDICGGGRPLAEVLARLTESGLGADHAKMLLLWALEKGLVGRC